MCKVRLLVIGDSEGRNRSAARSVKDQCTITGNDVKVSYKIIETASRDQPDPSEFDLAVLDDETISKGWSKEILGSGLPVLTFKDVSGSFIQSKSGTQIVISKIVVAAVERSRLREHIDMVTEQISATRMMMARQA